MKLHHIALGARKVDLLADFYQKAFDLPELTRHFYDDQRLRSVWLDLGGPILMIEDTDAQRPHRDGVDAGPFLLAFTITEEQRPHLEARLLHLGAPIESRTAYTSYARDPEGNRIAISFYAP